MRSTFATLALAALAAANPMPQAVSSAIAPSSSAPPGCSPDYDGPFQIAIYKASSKRDLVPRQHTALVIYLSAGILTDSQSRTGYVAANSQFQFDDPPQAGAIYTAGFSICQNGSLAIGGDAVWYQCLSGAGPTNQNEFYNLYSEYQSNLCSPVYIDAIKYTGSTSGIISPTHTGSSTTMTTSVTPQNGTTSAMPAGTGATTTAMMNSTTSMTSTYMMTTGATMTAASSASASSSLATSAAATTMSSATPSASPVAATGSAVTLVANTVFGLVAVILAAALI